MDVLYAFCTLAYTRTAWMVLEVSLWCHCARLDMLAALKLFGGATPASVIRGGAGAGESLADRRALPRAGGVTPSRRSSGVYQSPTTDRDQDWGLGGPTPDQCVCGCVPIAHNRCAKKGGVQKSYRKPQSVQLACSRATRYTPDPHSGQSSYRFARQDWPYSLMFSPPHIQIRVILY